MIKYVREHLSAKITLGLIALAIPILSAAAWYAAEESRAAAAEMILDQGRVAAQAGAASLAAILESGIDSGQLSLADVLDPSYEEMKFRDPSGQEIVVESRRYHTRLGDYTDAHGIQAIEDRVLAASPNFLYASAIDRRGYVPTPHRKYAEPPTGDRRHDRAVSRGKRMYDDPEQIAAAGFRGNPGKTTLVQDYHRDTGELIWDVAAPIEIRGQHFGAFRVGVVRDQVDLRTRDLGVALAQSLLVAVAALGLAVLLWMRRALRPLGQMAIAAVTLSTAGDLSELRAPIRSASRDEVGQIARALDRMRQSLVKVWDKV